MRFGFNGSLVGPDSRNLSGNEQKVIPASNQYDRRLDDTWPVDFGPPPPADWTNDIITATGQNSSTTQNIINIYFRRAIVVWVYSATEMQSALGKTTSTITGLRFEVIQEPANQPLPDYAIGMKNGSFSGNPGNTGYTIVKNQSSESFTTNTTKTFDPFDTSFEWTGGDLAIIIAWGQCPTGFSSSGVNPTGSGTMYYNRTDRTGSYVINVDSTNQTVPARPVVQLFG